MLNWWHNHFGKEHQPHRQHSRKEPSSGRPALWTSSPLFRPWHGLSYSYRSKNIIYIYIYTPTEAKRIPALRLDWTQSQRIFRWPFSWPPSASKFEYLPNESDSRSVSLWSGCMHPGKRLGLKHLPQVKIIVRHGNTREKAIFTRNASSPNLRPLKQHLVSKTSCSWKRGWQKSKILVGGFHWEIKISRFFWR